MSKNSQRNCTVELLRFVFSVVVMCLHINSNILGNPVFGNTIKFAFFSRGAIAVEFFFLLSGMLMAKSVDRQIMRCGKSSDLGKETTSFIWNKIKRILPCHLVSFVLVFAAFAALNASTAKGVVKLFVKSVPGIFFLQYSGIPCEQPNSIEWYISVMLLSLLILYPLCRRYYSVFSRIIAPVCSIFILGYLGYKYGTLTGVRIWDGFVFKGLLRGFAECSLGVWLYQLAKSLSALTFSKTHRVLLTVAEATCYIGVLGFTVTRLPAEFEFYALGALSAGITLTFSNVTYSGKLAPQKLSVWLGKLSLPIYMMQLAGIYSAQVLFDSRIHSAIYAIALGLILPIIYLVIAEAIQKSLSQRSHAD